FDFAPNLDRQATGLVEIACDDFLKRETTVCRHDGNVFRRLARVARRWKGKKNSRGRRTPGVRTLAMSTCGRNLVGILGAAGGLNQSRRRLREHPAEAA